MTLLVAGADRVDAGKTTFSTGLLAYLNRVGHASIGFKPRAGNDYWFDHDDVRLALSDDRLYGKDARRLAAASATTATATDGPVPEHINPLHRLWRPTQDRTGMLGDTGRTFLVDRLTTPDGTEFVVNGEAEDAGLIPEIVRESLPLSSARRVRSLEEFNEIMADRFLPAFTRLHDRIDTTEPAVVESYSDIALPLTGLEPDAVAVVAPGQTRIYRGDRYARACEVASGSPRDGQLEERTDAVEKLIEPVATVDLPALSSNAQKDPQAVADAYADAYSSLASLVGLPVSPTQ